MFNNNEGEFNKPNEFLEIKSAQDKPVYCRDVFYRGQRVFGISLTDYDYYSRIGVEENLDILSLAFLQHGKDGFNVACNALVSLRWDQEKKSIRDDLSLDRDTHKGPDLLNHLVNRIGFQSFEDFYQQTLEESGQE